MTPPPNPHPDVESIARGLTKAQRDALRRGRATGPDFCLAHVEPSLVKSCLCCLTPLGLQVRDYLERNPT